MNSLIPLVLHACVFFLNPGNDVTPTAYDWQSDLRYLQNTVHKDYPFLFKKTTAKEWDAAVDKLHEEIPAMQPHEIVTGFARIVAMFRYGHTDIDWNKAAVKSHALPLNLYWFSDGIYVEGARKDYADTVGAKVLKIAGMPIEQAVAAIRPLSPAENDQYFKAHGLDFLRIPEALHAQRILPSLQNEVVLLLERDGKSFERKVVAIPAQRIPRAYGFIQPGDDWVSARAPDKQPCYLKNLDKHYYFEYLPEQKTVYVRQSKVVDDPSESIATFYQRVLDFVESNDVHRLVIDVRLNGGGNNYKNKPVVTGIIRSRKINQRGKFFVLIGRRTYSACQNLVNELHNYTEAVFVGEPTGENINFYGDNRRVVLPKSKLPIALSFAWWQDKPQWENADWLAPQIAADMTFDDYRANRDPVLDAALRASADDVALDPIRHLKELFAANERDEVRASAERMVKDPRFKYVEFEDRINQAGYDLLQRDQLEPSMFVFQLNTHLFPKSANAWDSLAEAHWVAKKPENAVEYYKKAIQLDPNGTVGANAQKMLKEIESKAAPRSNSVSPPSDDKPTKPTAESAQSPIRGVEGQTLTSPHTPAVNIKLDLEFKYVGGHSFILYDVANAEQHFFVDADDKGRIKRMYWIQFEGYLPSNSNTYRYKRTKTVHIGNFEFIADAGARNIKDSPGRPDSDGNRARTFLESKGFRLMSDDVLNQRLVWLDEQNRNELMIIYSEDLSSNKLTAKDLEAGGPHAERLAGLLEELLRNAMKGIALAQR